MSKRLSNLRLTLDELNGEENQPDVVTLLPPNYLKSLPLWE
jgi:hypothetical protein